MAPAFNNLKDLEIYLLSKIEKTMEVTVASEVKKLESENVNDIVYQSYTPKIYERDMLEGGLADEKNMVHDVNINGNSIELSVENKTLNNPDYNPYNKPPFWIAGLIEYGDNTEYGYYDYPFKNKDKDVYKYLQPRPFIEKTKQDLQNGEARKMLVNGLNKEGIDAK